MGTVVCLPTAENMGRFCGHAVDCFPSHFQYRSAKSSPGEDLASFTTKCRTQRRSSECVAIVKTRRVPSRRGSLKDAAVMSSCDDSKNITTMNRGACALIVTSASPSSTRTSSASTLSGSGSRSGGGGGGGGEESGRRGSGGRRVTVFTVAPQVLITAVSTASTATANLLEALQKKRTKKRSAPFDDVVMSAENHVAADDMSNMQARQQNRASQVEVASPPDHRVTKDDSSISHTSPGRNGQLSKQGSLTIVRRSSTKKNQNHSGTVAGCPSSSSFADDEALDAVDLDTDNLPAVDTPDACDKAAIRLRCLLRQLQRGEISAELLQKNLHYAAKVLEAVFIDETKERGEEAGLTSDTEQKVSCSSSSSSTSPLHRPRGPSLAPVQQRRLRTPVWARRLADDDDELSEVQPDAVPPEVREWLASTFTRQMATTRRKSDEKPKFRSVAHAIRAGIFVDRIYRRVSNTALMQFPPDVVKVLKTLDEWSFDVFALSDAASSQPIKYLGYDLLNRYGMIHKFKVPPVTLEMFLSRVEEGYCRHKNPYHNNLHAADVAQTVHYMLCQTGLMNWLTDLEIFATLVAAIIHDYEHTGTTNNFHVMSGTETALLYNDRAVLENHHISASFRVIRDDECNILQNLSREEFREFRTLVIDMVLATDMSFHFQQLKNMKNLLTLAEPSVDKSKAMSLVLHCCDISHPAKRWDLHHRWTMLLLEEFFRQGDKERELGLPFSPLCDRNNTLVAESQIGFIEFIVEPSMAVCSDMLEAILGPIHSSCKPSDGAQQSISEDSETDKTKNGASSSPQRSLKFRIKKPWTACLGENKKSWKEQAARDAELRAQQQQQSDDPVTTQE